jgi:hypothetical protein
MSSLIFVFGRGSVAERRGTDPEPWVFPDAGIAESARGLGDFPLTFLNKLLTRPFTPPPPELPSPPLSLSL